MSKRPATPAVVAASTEQLQRLRAANARLREVVAGKAELLAAQEALIKVQGKQLAAHDALIGGQRRQIDLQGQLIDVLQQEIAELRRRLEADVSSAATPPSRGADGANRHADDDRPVAHAAEGS